MKTNKESEQIRLLIANLYIAISKLEARIIELERMHSFSNNIGPSLNTEEPIVTDKPIGTEYGNSWATTPTRAMELARLAKPTTFTREHDNLPVVIDRSNYADGYVPDDFRG